jgi:uncharacterized membrane protein YeaQ/YmgE (transglycosylase-associated protein family)
MTVWQRFSVWAWLGILMFWIARWLNANDANGYGIIVGVILGVLASQLAGPIWPSTSVKEASILDKN